MAEKKKIVMIDDEEDLCFMVKTNLEETGNYEVVTQTDPQQAENTIRQEKPDVVLMDVVMPGRKGTEVVAALKKDPETKKIPIIMVSGKGEMVFNKGKDEFKWVPNSKIVKDRGELPDARGAEALAEAYHVNDYVSKPFTTDLLAQVIEDVLKATKKGGEEKSSGGGEG